MPLTISCSCGQHYSVDEQYAGQKVPCSVCQRILTIPQPDVTATVSNLSETEPFLAEEEPARGGGGAALLALVATVLIIFVLGGGLAGGVWWLAHQEAQKQAAIALERKAQERPDDLAKFVPQIKEDEKPKEEPRDEKDKEKDKNALVEKDKDREKPKEPEKDKDKEKEPAELPKLSPPTGLPWKGHEATILAVAVDRAGQNVWTASGGTDDRGRLMPDSTLRRWDAAKGIEGDRLELTERGIAAATFDAECKRAAVAVPGKTTIELYDLATKKLLATLDEHRKSVRSLAFSGDGKRLVSGGDDGLVMVWDLSTNKTVHKLVGHTKPVDGVAVSADGRAAISGCRDHTARLWDLDKGDERKELSGHGDIVWAAAFSADGKLALTGGGQHQVSATVFTQGTRDYEVRCWDPTTAREKGRAKPLEVAVTALAFSPDGRRYLAGGSDGSLELWQLTTNKESLRLKGHSARVRAVAFFSTGRKAVSVGEDRTIRVWDLPADLPELARDVKGNDAGLRTAALAELTRLAADAKPAIPEMFEALTVGDDEWKGRVIELLKTFSPLDAEYLARLEVLLKDRKYLAGRQYAVEEIAKLGEKARPAAKTLLATVADEDLEVRRKALGALAPVIDELGGKAFEPLLAALRDKDAGLREQAEKAIEKLGPPGVEHLKLLQKMLGEDGPALKRFALKALGEMGEPAGPALAEVIERSEKDSAPAVRRQAFEALAKIAPTDARTVTASVKGLEDRTAAVQRQAATALAGTGDVPALCAAMEHEDDEVRKTADEALKKPTFAKKHLPLLIKLVESKRGASRGRGIEALGGLKAEAAQAVPSVAKALKGAGAEERKQILALFVSLGAAAKPAGKEVVALMTGKDKVADLEVCEVLVKIESPEVKSAVPGLMAQLRPTNGEDFMDEEAIAHREKVRKMLVSIGKPAVDPILQAVEGKYSGGKGDEAIRNGVARLAMVKALAEIGRPAYSSETLAVLARLRRADREPFAEVREAAKAAYVAVQKKD